MPDKVTMRTKKSYKLIAHRVDVAAIERLHRVARARRQTIAQTLSDAILSLRVE